MISASVLTNNQQGSGSSITTAPITPGANKLIIVFVGVENDGSLPNYPTAVSGCGMTWVLVGGRRQVAHNTLAMSIFRGLSSSPSSGALTITLAESEAFAGWSVLQFDGIDTGGTNGSNAVVQFGGNDWFDTSTTRSVSLSPLGSANNATAGMYWEQGTTVVSTGSGFTNLVAQAGSNNYNNTEWAINQQNPTWGWGGALSSAEAMGIEIKAKVTAGGFILSMFS